jgi:thiamine transport system permease protein
MQRWRSAALALLPLLALVALLLAPVLRLAGEGWWGALATQTPSAPWALWQDPYLRWRVLWSLVQAGATCIAALLLGLPVAWVCLLYTSDAADDSYSV